MSNLSGIFDLNKSHLLHHYIKPHLFSKQFDLRLNWLSSSFCIAIKHALLPHLTPTHTDTHLLSLYLVSTVWGSELVTGFCAMDDSPWLLQAVSTRAILISVAAAVIVMILVIIVWSLKLCVCVCVSQCSCLWWPVNVCLLACCYLLILFPFSGTLPPLCLLLQTISGNTYQIMIHKITLTFISCVTLTHSLTLSPLSLPLSMYKLCFFLF